MNEDSFRLTTEVKEVTEKSSVSTIPGEKLDIPTVEFEDEGTKKRAIIALGNNKS